MKKASKKPRTIPLAKVDPIQQQILNAGLNAQPLSALLRIAVADMKRAKARGRKLDMDLYTTRDGCACCMAGAVMCERVGTHLRPTWAIAIDAARMGSVRAAMEHLKAPWAPNEKQVEALDAARRIIQNALNDRSGRAPMRTYLKAADVLEAGGL